MASRHDEVIKKRIEEIAEEKGVELVEFKIFSSPDKYIVRCLLDYPRGGITVEACAVINREIFSFLTEKGFLGEDFVVEVNSPGLDRPLKTYKDFLRVKGGKILLWLNEPFEGEDYFEGELADVNPDKIIIKSKKDIKEIDLSKVKSGKFYIDV